MQVAFEVNKHNIALHVNYIMKENLVRNFSLEILLFECFLLKNIYFRTQLLN